MLILSGRQAILSTIPLLFAPLKIDKSSPYSAAAMVLRGIVEPSLVILAVGFALLAATMVYARWRWEL